MNAQHPRLFDRRAVVSLALLIALYVLLAEIFQLNLASLRLPAYHPVAHRIGEIAALWTIAILFRGWFAVLVQRGRSYEVNVRGVAVLPAAVGIVVTVYKFTWSFRQYDPTQEASGYSDLLVRIAASAWPFLMGLGAATCLLIHGRLWRTMSATRQPNETAQSTT